MSAEASGYVFRSSPYRGTQFAVHLAIADSVNDQHDNEFWMSLATLAKKARVSRSMVREAVIRLLRDEFLTLLETHDRQPNRYRFCFPEVTVVYESRRNPPSDHRRGGIRPPEDPPPTTGVEPNTTQGEPKEHSSSSANADALCDELEHLIIANGSKAPTVGKGWHDAARLLLDRDGRPFEEALRLIRWCQAHEFWRANIRSMPTFREKYDQLRLQAARPRAGPRTESEKFRAMIEEAKADGLGEGREARGQDGGVLSGALGAGDPHGDLGGGTSAAR